MARVTGADMTAGKILILCARPGFRRAGIEHPAKASYPLDHFTRRQLDLLQAEPLLVFEAVGGEPVASDEVGRAVILGEVRDVTGVSQEVRERAAEATRAAWAGSADAGVEARAALDTAREDLRERGGADAVMLGHLTRELGVTDVVGAPAVDVVIPAAEGSSAAVAGLVAATEAGPQAPIGPGLVAAASGPMGGAVIADLAAAEVAEARAEDPAGTTPADPGQHGGPGKAGKAGGRGAR